MKCTPAVQPGQLGVQSVSEWNLYVGFHSKKLFTPDNFENSGFRLSWDHFILKTSIFGSTIQMLFKSGSHAHRSWHQCISCLLL